MGNLADLKAKMREDKELSKMLVRSGLHEIQIDLDGDGWADLVLSDYNRDGDIDAAAVDTTGEGDFNIYIFDLDKNGKIDTIDIYRDYDNDPIVSISGKEFEENLSALADAVYTRVIAGEFIAATAIDAMNKLQEQAKEEYAKFLATLQEAKEAKTAEALPKDEDKAEA